MKTFEIEYERVSYRVYQVEADSEEEAIQKADESLEEDDFVGVHAGLYELKSCEELTNIQTEEK